MKRHQIEIGAVYRARISGKLTDVRIDRRHTYGGWAATDLATGRNVRIKTAQKLRYLAHGTTAIPAHRLTEIARQIGLQGIVFIEDHTYYYNNGDKRQKLGHSPTQAEEELNRLANSARRWGKK